MGDGVGLDVDPAESRDDLAVAFAAQRRARRPAHARPVKTVPAAGVRRPRRERATHCGPKRAASSTRASNPPTCNRPPGSSRVARRCSPRETVRTLISPFLSQPSRPDLQPNSTASTL
jgi:hypothetical protein